MSNQLLAQSSVVYSAQYTADGTTAVNVVLAPFYIGSSKILKVVRRTTATGAPGEPSIGAPKMLAPITYSPGPAPAPIGWVAALTSVATDVSIYDIYWVNATLDTSVVAGNAGQSFLI